jgi:Leucine-rich repeat (LRR) protein
LQVLELRKNQLPNCEGIENLPLLEALYLGENQIKSISGLKNLPSLKRLHLRNNELVEFDEVPDLPSLEYLNLRETKIESIKEIKKLKGLSTIRRIGAQGAPVAETDFIKELLLANEGIKYKFINKEEITPELLEEVKTLKEERRLAEEEK